MNLTVESEGVSLPPPLSFSWAVAEPPDFLVVLWFGHVFLPKWKCFQHFLSGKAHSSPAQSVTQQISLTNSTA